LLDLFQELLETPRPISSLEKSELQAMIDPQKPNTTRLALDILSSQGLDDYHEPMVYADQAGLNRALIYHDNGKDEISNVYPNPANDFIQLRANENRSLRNCNVEITDITGRIVQERISINDSIEETFIDISGLELGNYLLTIYSGDKPIYIQQFFKE
jgi:Secretion system C-terminal sorting domain